MLPSLTRFVTGFVRVMENLESRGILGLESCGICMNLGHGKSRKMKIYR